MDSLHISSHQRDSHLSSAWDRKSTCADVQVPDGLPACDDESDCSASSDCSALFDRMCLDDSSSCTEMDSLLGLSEDDDDDDDDASDNEEMANLDGGSAATAASNETDLTLTLIEHNNHIGSKYASHYQAWYRNTFYVNQPLSDILNAMTKPSDSHEATMKVCRLSLDLMQQGHTEDNVFAFVRCEVLRKIRQDWKKVSQVCCRLNIVADRLSKSFIAWEGGSSLWALLGQLIRVGIFGVDAIYGFVPQRDQVCDRGVMYMLKTLFEYAGPAICEDQYAIRTEELVEFLRAKADDRASDMIFLEYFNVSPSIGYDS